MKYYQEAGGSSPGKQIEHSGCCDICGQTDCPAIFDAALLVGPRRVWAWACQRCFDERGGRLGIGQGQLYKRGAT